MVRKILATDSGIIQLYKITLQRKNMKKKKTKKEIFAFVHIEKAAGTTFIHLLRRNFFLRYIDVRPLSEKSNRIFSLQDLKKYLIINPFLKCIGGHAVVPYSALANKSLNIKFITLLREPVFRYISHYQYWVEKRQKKISFDEFLKLDWMKNFQVKKIAGSENLTLAKKIIKDWFFLVGIAEEFDEFLICLQMKILPRIFCPYYKIHNVGINNNIKNDILSKYYDQIIEKNELDIKLYFYVKNEIIPNLIKQYGTDFRENINHFKKLNDKYRPPTLKSYIDFMCRKIYYERISNGIRYINSMPMKGYY